MDWRQAWRDGAAPLLSEAGLRALEAALERDDPRLLQGATTTPPPLRSVAEWPCDGACALSYPGWQGDGLVTVREVEEAFGTLCFRADVRLGEPTAIRHFISWFDDTPRDDMRRELLPEVQAELRRRHAAA